MSAKDNLLHKIIALYGVQEQGFTAQDCEDFVSVNRSVVSHYLNPCKLNREWPARAVRIPDPIKNRAHLNSTTFNKRTKKSWINVIRFNYWNVPTLPKKQPPAKLNISEVVPL